MIVNLLFALSLLLNPLKADEGTVAAACNAQPYINNATSKLEGYRFLKSYTISGKSKVTFNYICTTGQVYMLRLDKGGNAEGVYVTIKDATGRVITKSYKDGKYLPGAAFRCGKTGKYSFEYTFTNSDYCAGSALGFKR